MVAFVGGGFKVSSNRKSAAISRCQVKMIAEETAVSRRSLLNGIAAATVTALIPANAFAEAVSVDAFQDSVKGFKMVKPSGWNEFGASESFDVKFQDIIQPLEQITVLTTPVTKGKTVKDIGTPEEVAAKLAKSRQSEPVGSYLKEKDGIITYIIEMKSSSLRQLVVLTINKSKLYTVNLACPENRWDKREKLMKTVAESFQPRL